MNSSNQRQKAQEFINCELEYECSKNWFELEPSNKAGVKHCRQCKNDVHLCINQEELNYAILQKRCIAYFHNPSLQTRFKLSREKCNARKTDANFATEMIVGLPKNLGHLQKRGIDLLFELNEDNGLGPKD